MMKTYHDLVFEKVQEKDIEVLSSIMKRAFDEDSRIHLQKECSGPLGYDNGDFLRRFALDDASTAYKISKGGKVVGAIILWINTTTHHNYLGNVFLDPVIENKGVGKMCWDFVEQEFSNTEVWRTDTPIYSRRNHHFYINKCGFHVVKIENPQDIEKGSFILEKKMK